MAQQLGRPPYVILDPFQDGVQIAVAPYGSLLDECCIVRNIMANYWLLSLLACLSLCSFASSTLDLSSITAAQLERQVHCMWTQHAANLCSIPDACMVAAHSG